MKYNKQLTEIVPPEIRLKVYKKALNLIKNWKVERGNTKQRHIVFGELCILLPALLYDKKNWLNNKDWHSGDTKLAFTELNNQFFNEISSCEITDQVNGTVKNKNQVRIKYLKKWIKELEEIQNKSEN